MEQIIIEKTASRGIAVAPVYLYQEPDLTPVPYYIQEDQIPGELEKFQKARETVCEELAVLAEENEVLGAHLELAKDRGLKERVNEKIQEERKNAQLALFEVIEEIAAMFTAMEAVYMKERGDDIRDIGKWLMAALKESKRPNLGAIRSEVIVAARDLYPSDTVKLNPALVKGILTEAGGITSHVSILAKSMNIPILVGVKNLLSKVKDGEILCMDAEKGIIVVEPDEETRTEYLVRKENQEKECKKFLLNRNTPAVTKDGKRILLCANVGSIQDIRNALSMNIDGVGLFRTEFLYMENSHFPTEEEQFAVYREAAELCPGELTIRTLDIGGDKELPYFPFEKEENPFLGWRAIRISLEMKDMFKEQIRAILRASAFGHVRIMFPMIISPEELRAAKDLVAECKQELKAEGKAFDEDIELGMMMETPASVLLAEEFAQEADFFSIGTNDLTQYLLAVDRGNQKVADRYDTFHPAVLRAIGHIIEAGHKAGIRVGMCGEMAGEPEAVPVLLELGLDEFSMVAGSMDYVRKRIIEEVNR